MPQYYIKDSHPAIIDPANFDLVQQEMERRRPNRRQLHKNSPFNAKIICGECGGYYGRKVWHSGSRYQKYIWRCNYKYENDTTCQTPNLTEEEIKTASTETFNMILADKKNCIERLEARLSVLSDTSQLEKELQLAKSDHADLIEKLRQYMEANTRQVQDQAEYNRRFNEMDADCNAAEEQVGILQERLLAQTGQREQIRRCLSEIKQCGDALDGFSLDLWDRMVGSVTVSLEKELTFLFLDGTKTTVKVP